nr:MAG: hypothetical protein [Cressdnaviricota sp.]
MTTIFFFMNKKERIKVQQEQTLEFWNGQFKLEVEDSFYPFHKWPKWAQKSFEKPHKDRRERMYLFVFFWKNGMEPTMAKNMVLAHGNIPSLAIRRRMQWGYDISAETSLDDLVDKTKTEAGKDYLLKIKVLNLDSNTVE